MKLQSHRLVDGYYETALHELISPESLSSVSLIGVTHTAEPQFYKSLKEYIDSRENQGSLVHFENCETPTQAVLDTYPRWVRQAVPTMDMLLTRLNEPDSGYNEVAQSDPNHFSYGSSWEANDLDMANVVLRFGRLRTKIVLKILKSATTHNEHSNSKKYNKWVDIVQDLGFLALTDNVVLNQRNKVAVDAVVMAHKKEPCRDISLVWGDAHLPGIAKGLFSKKYRHSRTIWNRAYKLDPT